MPDFGNNLIRSRNKGIDSWALSIPITFHEVSYSLLEHPVLMSLQIFMYFLFKVAWFCDFATWRLQVNTFCQNWDLFL